LGLAIRATRLEHQITQEELGKRAGIHPTWISHIESGRVNPTISNLALLSEALGIKLSAVVAAAEELDREMQSQ
jgi:XRE family transcriptional regulator, regulator of sulfur utilization